MPAQLVAVSGAVRDRAAKRLPACAAGGRRWCPTASTPASSASPRLKGRGPDVLYVGRLGYRKGLFRLLEAFARLPAGHRARADPGRRGAARGRPAAARGQRSGIAGRVRFAGFLDRMGVRRELRDAACFVNPADYETGPLTAARGHGLRHAGGEHRHRARRRVRLATAIVPGPYAIPRRWRPP